jgi:hypothetical protein
MRVIAEHSKEVESLRFGTVKTGLYQGMALAMP